MKIEDAATQMAEHIRTDFPNLKPPPVREWLRTPAARVVDCVLSLQKDYRKVVTPRVKRFSSQRPDTRTCADLRALIDSFDDIEAFGAEVLNMRGVKRATVLSGVVDYLLDIHRRFDGDDEDARLGAWAQWARPGDYLSVGVRGFGLAGFQYLRIHFGADTVKPDMHTIGYVEHALGEPVTPAQAVYILERAGELLEEPVRAIDAALWERGSGGRLGE